MTINERVRQVRKELRMSQEAFGSKLGITKSAVSTIESGKNNVTDTMAKLICSEFNVYYLWLTEGKGDMFTGFPDSKIDELKEEFDLSDAATSIIRKFVNMSEEKQNVIIELFTPENVNKKDDS